MKNEKLPDFWLTALLLALFALGLTALYSAGGEARFWTQAWRGGAGIALMLAVAFAPPRWIESASPLFFLAVLAALIAVLLFGVKINNARRWLNIGILVQPSELMKIALPMCLAYGYARCKNGARWPHHFCMLGVTGVAAFLVARQPDLGTALMVAAAGLLAVFFSGIGWRWIAGLSAAALASLLPVWFFVLKPYQQERVLAVLNPEGDPLGAGYHIIQSKIAVGSGGAWGKGFLAGTQAQFDFLPERHTDFIFAVYAEEFGWAGGCFMLSLAALITWRCLVVAGRMPDFFGYLTAACIGGAFFINFSVNLCMVSGLLPVVGLPLPLVSYGGTALLASFAGFGVVLALARGGGRGT